jgi:Uma2 family endonuclease
MTPDPNPPHWIAVKEVFSALLKYSQEHPAILGSVGPGGRLITRALGATTNVQPDICAYRQTVTRKHRTWHHIMPCLVVEVLSETDRDKDLVRNRDIYGLVAEIEEYWVVDAYAEPEATLLAFLRDADGRWGLERRVPPGGTYRTDLLPGFELDLAAIFREP